MFPREGRPSSSGRSQKEGDDPSIQRTQTFGQRFMDNLFLRNLTSQPKSSAAEVSVPSSPHKVINYARAHTLAGLSYILLSFRRVNMINRGILINNYYFLLQQVDPAEPDNREEESPALGTIRGKCITQLLLLGAINSIQVLRCLLYL